MVSKKICALTLETTRTCIKEIPQVSDEKWDRHPNPHAGSKDIGPPRRVRCILYFDRCKFHLNAAKARVLTSSFFLLSSVYGLTLCCACGLAASWNTWGYIYARGCTACCAYHLLKN